MGQRYTYEKWCQICDWHISEVALSQLALMELEEKLDAMAQEHVKTVHPLDFEKKGQVNG
ncbi:hypothetical protein [Rothia nasimurium]|uniref:hypothetical protein n=1 Tax=Rothia nasimurium TaxID=85336 RepID=UPI001F24AEF5|nr:hypothetical protein [Rothia nasimurium]